MVAALSELPGIQSEAAITVFLDRDAFTVTYNPRLTSLQDMYDAILELGYVPSLNRDSDSASNAGETVADTTDPIADVLTQAVAEGKNIFIDFFAEWCIACRALDEQTLSDPDIVAILQNYIVLRIDTDLFPHTAAAHGIIGMPTLLVIDSAGNELFRSVGPISAELLASRLSSFLPAQDQTAGRR